jgi:exonuclease SbcC
MIEYEYTLERNEGNGTRKLCPNPNIGKKLPDLVLIEAPNSSGKSTLLNLIAVGFYGLKNTEEVTDTLLEDMRNLMRSNQKLAFNIKIEEKKYILISEKKINEEEPTVYILEPNSKKQSPITPETFEREYRLVYEIPDKPRERIREVLKDLGSLYNEIEKDISSFREYLSQVLEEIEQSPTPEEIAKKEEQINEYSKKISEWKDEYNNKKASRENLTKYLNIKWCINYKDKLSNLENKLKTVQKVEKKITREINEIQIARNGMWNAINYIKKTEGEIKNILSKITLLEISSRRGDIMKAISNIVNEEELSVLEEYCWKGLKTLSEIKNVAEEALRSRENLLSTEILERDLIKQLLDLLGEYQNHNLNLPGTEKPIIEYLSVLRKELEKKEKLLAEADLLKKFIEKINEIHTYLNTFFDNLENFKELNKRYPNLIKQKEKNLIDVDSEDVIKKKIDEIKNKYQEYLIECKNCGVNVDNLESELKAIEDALREMKKEECLNYDENALTKTIEELDQKLKNLDDKIKEGTSILEHEKLELEKMKKKPPHKYLPQKKKINELYTITEQALKLFRTLFSWNSKLYKGENANQATGIKQYNESIGYYLAMKIGEVRYVGEERYKVEIVDLLGETLTLEGGRRINLRDLGTGAMQAAYFQSILNKSDKRKIIALFDEISDMDTKTLITIFEKIRELYKSGKLIACIMVRRCDDTVKITDLTREVSL